jgi:hypothetical protein
VFICVHQWQKIKLCASSEEAEAKSTEGGSEGIEHLFDAHFLTNDAILWSSLQPASLTIPTSDLTLKYGSEVSGRWNLLYLLDAWADKGEPPDVASVWSAGGRQQPGRALRLHTPQCHNRSSHAWPSAA